MGMWPLRSRADFVSKDEDFARIFPRSEMLGKPPRLGLNDVKAQVNRATARVQKKRDHPPARQLDAYSK